MEKSLSSLTIKDENKKLLSKRQAYQKTKAELAHVRGRPRDPKSKNSTIKQAGEILQQQAEVEVL